WTLLHLRYDRHILATNGTPGGANKCTGADGEDKWIEVPVGSVIYNAETGAYIADLREDGQEICLLSGGKGGKGNTFFKSATNQAPRYAQPGEPSQELTIIIQLKMLADVGLVGLPNVGKSTLISVLTTAKPKIANYPFTTLEPSLGIVPYRDNKSFVMADIPGIIEGAAEGKGLGLEFLRHIERNALLLFMIPADTEHIGEEYQTLLNELIKYNPSLANKHRVLAITKSDLIDEELQEMLKGELPKDIPTIFISAVAHKNLDKLKDILWTELSKETLHEPDDIAHQDLDLSKITWDEEEDVQPIKADESDDDWEDDEDDLIEIEWED
ncbi:MAG: GTPase ObgE, partial [Porphyromonadaceae bacterium]|nr:GTPase ObgE [Porphyromonadaceae bacterium]